MVLTFIAGFGAVFGAAEGIRASQGKSRREEHRTRKQNLVVHCPKSSQHSPQLEGRQIVLSGDRLFVDTGSVHDAVFGHPVAGYFLPYPDQRYSGFVTTITDEAPIMNWVFVDRDSLELKFGNRQVSEGEHTGPFDVTRQDKRLTFGGWEGFCVVLEDSGVWGLYFDRDGDLRAKLSGRVVIEIEIIRRELKAQRPVMEVPEQPSPEQKQQQETQAQPQPQPQPTPEAQPEKQPVRTPAPATSQAQAPPRQRQEPRPRQNGRRRSKEDQKPERRGPTTQPDAPSTSRGAPAPTRQPQASTPAKPPQAPLQRQQTLPRNPRPPPRPQEQQRTQQQQGTQQQQRTQQQGSQQQRPEQARPQQQREPPQPQQSRRQRRQSPPQQRPQRRSGPRQNGEPQSPGDKKARMIREQRLSGGRFGPSPQNGRTAAQENIDNELLRLEDMIKGMNYRSPSAEEEVYEDVSLPPSPASS